MGIFVTAVQPGSPAALQGLTPGDKIIKVRTILGCSSSNSSIISMNKNLRTCFV